MPPRKRPWFRVYVEMVWDRKIRRLEPSSRWLWVVLLACARSSPEPGRLLLSEGDPMHKEDIADAAALSGKDVDKGLDILTKRHLITFDKSTDTWVIPKWNERQFESDTKVDRTTLRGSNDPPNGSGNSNDPGSPETESETEADKQPSPSSDLAQHLRARFDAEDVAVVVERIEGRKTYGGKEIKDRAAYAEAVLSRMAHERKAKTNGAQKTLEVDGDTYVMTDSGWELEEAS